MLNDTDAARRRALQHRAFAPGGGLSDAEAAELRALNAKHAGERMASGPSADGPSAGGPSTSSGTQPEFGAGEPVAEPVEAPHGSAGGPSTSSGTQREFGAGESIAEPVEAPHGSASGPSTSSGTQGAEEREGPPAGPGTQRSRRRWLAPVAAILTLLVGFGGGWLAFGRGDRTVAMTDAQRDRWVEFEASNHYDPGSVQLVGSQDGADVWQATKEEAKSRCILLTVGERDSAQCQPNEDDYMMYGLHAGLSIDSGTEPVMYWASIMVGTTGEPVAIVQRQDAGSWDWRSQYNEQELAIVDFLVSEGFQAEVLQLLGYDGETPIWLHQGAETCILVASAEQMIGQACGELGVEPGQSLDLAVAGSTYSVRASDTRGPMLTVIRTSPSAGDSAQECTDCASIDDKTGAVGD